MRRVVFIVLMVVVAAVVAFFCWREFLVPDINFVADYTGSESENHIKIQRLYAAEIDIDAYMDQLESIMNTTDYTDEEMFAAAIAAGEPAFFPFFSIGVYRLGDEIRLDGITDSEIAEGQNEQQFRMGNISLEVIITQGDLVIERVEISRSSDSKDKKMAKINNEQTASVDISNAKSFSVAMGGEEGTVTLRFVYSIESGTLLPKMALEEQLLEIHANIKPGAGENLEVEFINEPYSSLEQING